MPGFARHGRHCLELDQFLPEGDRANAVFRGAGWDVPVPNLFKLSESFGNRIVLRNDVIGFRLLREGGAE
jgi:hypothetical protein